MGRYAQAMPWTIACAQFAPAKADLAANLDRMASLARQASEEGADLVVFPETATSGYFLEGGVLESALTYETLQDELTRRLEGLPRPLDLCVGFYEKDRGTLYNSAAYLGIAGASVQTLHVYRKFFLPTYGVFDEERFVSRGRELGVFDTRLGRMAILICEDVWHSVLPALAAVAGATTMLVPAASPARGMQGERPENLERYERLLRGIAEEHGVFCANAMLCGFEGGKGFVGGSMIVDPQGRVLVRGPVQEEYLLVAPIDPEETTLARAQAPLLADLRSAWGDIARLVGATA
jgi:predicted amidohydrolase